MRIAVVTGAARGIGAEIAKALAKQGNYVVLLDLLETELEETVREIVNEDGEAESMVMDVGDEQQVIKTFNFIRDKFDRIDILVNNAGISPKKNGQRRSPHEISLEEWEKVLKVNLTGTFLCVRESLPVMMKGNWGRIVNITSLAGRTSSRIAGAHYSASKSGLGGFTRTVASEYGTFGITANCVAPGRIESPMTASSTKEANEKFIKEVPVGRSGEAKEVASLVSFLCSMEAGYINGATVDINGGIFMS